MERPQALGQRWPAVDYVAEDVQPAAQEAGANRHIEAAAGVPHGIAARKAPRRRERDGAHGVCVHMTDHFEHRATVGAGLEPVSHRGQLGREPHIDDVFADRDGLPLRP